jgi:hypothetical protein
LFQIFVMAAPDFELFTSLRYDPLLTTLPVNTEAWDSDVKQSSPFYMLSYHRDRLLEAAEHFAWAEIADSLRGPKGFTILLKKLNDGIANLTQSQSPLRVRVLLRHEGSSRIEMNPTTVTTAASLFPNRIPPPKSAAQMKVSPLTGGVLTVGDGDAVHGDPPMGEAWDVLPDTQRVKPSLFTSYKTTSRDMYMAARQRVGIHDMAEKKEVLIISEKDGEIMEGSLTSVFFWRNGKWTTPPISSGGQIGTTRRWALEKG